MKAQIAADLREAAAVLRRDGWTQGVYHLIRDGKVCHCANGALAIATGAHINVRPSPDREYDRENGPHNAGDRWYSAQNVLRSHVGAPISAWNDQPERTAEQVIAALEAAADAAEKA